MQQDEIGILHIFCICILARILILFWHQEDKESMNYSPSNHLTVRFSSIFSKSYIANCYDDVQFSLFFSCNHSKVNNVLFSNIYLMQMGKEMALK